jgi:hypothetical protein
MRQCREGNCAAWKTIMEQGELEIERLRAVKENEMVRNTSLREWLCSIGRMPPGITAKEAGAQLLAENERLRAFAEKVPTSWLDPLLTGPTAVIGEPPYNCQDIEKLLRAVAARIGRCAAPEGKL